MTILKDNAINQQTQQNYEEMLTDLKNIIEDFQKGNMKLSQAVEKYNKCLTLIQECNKSLDQAQKIIEAEKSDDIAIITELENVDFEANIQELDKMLLSLNNEKDLKLDDLIKIGKESKLKIAQCEHVLDKFQTLVEYVN